MNTAFASFEDLYTYDVNIGFAAGTNVMGLVSVSVAIAIAMGIMQSEVKSLSSVINESYLLTMKLTSWAICLSPIGIFFLVVAEILSIDDLGRTGSKLGLYFLTVLTGCLLQGFVILPLLYFIFTRLNPYRFIYGLLQAMITAFGTSSR